MSVVIIKTSSSIREQKPVSQFEQRETIPLEISASNAREIERRGE